jgi:hypothetical protein
VQALIQSQRCLGEGGLGHNQQGDAFKSNAVYIEHFPAIARAQWKLSLTAARFGSSLQTSSAATLKFRSVVRHARHRNFKVKAAPKRDEIRMNRHRALGSCLGMIFSENRCTLFRIMPYHGFAGAPLIPKLANEGAAI